MKKNKKRIALISIILLFLGGTAYWVTNPGYYRLEVMQVEESGYGYKIYKGKRAVIAQPFIPGIAGKKPFRTNKEAQRVGNLVLERVKRGEDFAISKEDLKSLGTFY